MSTKLTSVTQKRLRELAPRALHVLEQHKELHLGVPAAATTLAPAAEAYIKVYDEAVRFQATQSSEMEQGRQSLAELDKEVRSCLAILRGVVPDAAVNDLGGSIVVPERLISDARKVLELLGQAGKSVPSGDGLSALLAEAVKKAETEWEQAQTARMALQQSQQVVREHAIALNREMVALRRLLRTLVGTSHLAYQTLRVAKIKGTPVVDDEDNTVVEDASVVESSAAEVTGTPAHTVSNGATNGAAATTPLSTGGIAA